MKKTLLTLTMLGCTLGAHAEMQVEKVAYELDGKSFEGQLIYDDAVKDARPALLMVPNWLGPTDVSAEKAKRVAGDRYVIFMADMYGTDVRPQNTDEAGKAAGAVRADRAMMRNRAQKALDVLKAQSGKVKIATDQIGAIGFCFGGGTVLELARSGADVAGVVSFHGNLDTPDPKDAQNIKTRVLVLHGADDPYVPKDQVDAFVKEMQATKADWQLVAFGNAVHSFTDPTANMPGQAQYDEQTAKRAFTMMQNFFDESFGAKP